MDNDTILRFVDKDRGDSGGKEQRWTERTLEFLRDVRGIISSI